jgi:hypothetical protein
MLVTRFDYLLVIIRPKTCGSIIKRNNTNSLLPIKVKLIPMVIKNATDHIHCIKTGNNKIVEYTDNISYSHTNTRTHTHK